MERLSLFVEDKKSDATLTSFFTYADGCRYLQPKNVCQLHAESGRESKPRICRLFPFSRLVQVDGLLVLLPQPTCPWTGASDSASGEVSDHAFILQDLDKDFVSQLNPQEVRPLTPLEAERRMTLETTIRDALPDHETNVVDALNLMLGIHAQVFNDVRIPPVDEELWIDLLRTAGWPPPLPKKSARLLLAALPMLRIELLETFELRDLPLALAAFEVWLRTLGELNAPVLRGDDMLRLLNHAIPLLRILVTAEDPLPPLPTQAPSENLQEIWDTLLKQHDMKWGEAILKAFKPVEQGALQSIRELGQWMPFFWHKKTLLV